MSTRRAASRRKRPSLRAVVSPTTARHRGLGHRRRACRAGGRRSPASPPLRRTGSTDAAMEAAAEELECPQVDVVVEQPRTRASRARPLRLSLDVPLDSGSRAPVGLERPARIRQRPGGAGRTRFTARWRPSEVREPEGAPPFVTLQSAGGPGVASRDALATPRPACARRARRAGSGRGRSPEAEGGGRGSGRGAHHIADGIRHTYRPVLSVAECVAAVRVAVDVGQRRRWGPHRTAGRQHGTRDGSPQARVFNIPPRCLGPPRSVGELSYGHHGWSSKVHRIGTVGQRPPR